MRSDVSQDPLANNMDRPLSPRPNFLYRHKYWLAFGVLISGFFAYANKSNFFAHFFRSPVEIAKLQNKKSLDEVSMRVTVGAKNVVILAAPAGGRVENIKVENGDIISKHDVVLELSNTALELDIAKTQTQILSEIGQIERSIRQEKIDLLSLEEQLEEYSFDKGRAETKRENVEELYNAGRYPKVSYEEIISNIDALSMKVSTTRNKLEIVQADYETQLLKSEEKIEKLNESLSLSKNILERLTVRSPIEGQITELKVKDGEVVALGSVIAKLLSDEDFKLVGTIDEFYRDKLTLGAISTTKSNGYGNFKMTNISPTVENGQFMLEFEPIDHTEGPKRLFLGQSLTLNIPISSDDTLDVDTNIQNISNSSILKLNGKKYIFVMNDENTQATREIFSSALFTEENATQGVYYLVSLPKNAESVSTVDIPKFAVIDVAK